LYWQSFTEQEHTHTHTKKVHDVTNKAKTSRRTPRVKQLNSFRVFILFFPKINF